MDAILLTHDVQLGLAELVHRAYAALWPDHPFTFRVPINGTASGQALSYLAAQPDCRLVPAPRSIRESMLALLQGVPEEAWVFWCIDDRFPTVVSAEALADVVAGLGGLDGDDAGRLGRVDEVKLLRWKEGITREPAVVGSVPYVVQAAGTRHRGFWHHHFVRAGTLRRVFGRADLEGSTAIRDVLGPLHPERRGRRWERARIAAEAGLFGGRALVPRMPLVRLGEPLVTGRLTRNGREELHRRGCEVPPYPSIDRDMVYG